MAHLTLLDRLLNFSFNNSKVNSDHLKKYQMHKRDYLKHIIKKRIWASQWQ